MQESIPYILIGFFVSILPLIVVMMTAFTKISIVFMLLRNAIGLQQAPPSILLMGIALVLSIFLIAPVIDKTVQQFDGEDFSNKDLKQWYVVVNKVSAPIKSYLNKFTTEESKEMFITVSQEVWPEDFKYKAEENSIFIVIPSYVLSELKRAFEIGFLLFLPFLIIDLVVTNILLAMGSMMMSPSLISLPIKLLLFVSVDGWTTLIESLLLSYSI
ncbi:type III secretion system export apparatus subunit SctR [Endozoicomonas sp. SM1973]|uniref:Type III secretion system export apparatus subunit SctR n=1 Tax=Spartinivicinus marinus TaxID=2994442 RepID=A0A853I616_9GAMM|nr:type III secretion system export apparatus subunit SctR [Spartinivicinus marinus]MCX4029077.1 type III secretion system export apparatus subunit SctR [Spartinivicinus marinus]NYZ68773.1 type III secretion system export apparatus subunit SctR [Spartinivicinus marinus]